MNCRYCGTAITEHERDSGQPPVAVMDYRDEDGETSCPRHWYGPIMLSHAPTPEVSDD